MTSLWRRLWQAVEPLHAVIYFAQEPADAAEQLGLRGWWMGYFAGRFAPLGALPPEPATAMAYGFAPSMVARALPDAWSFAAPAAVLDSRILAAAATLSAHVEHPVDELDALLWRAVASCSFDGRPLGAGWSSVRRPDDTLASLWVATTVLREHRGDGHVLAAVASGLSGLDAIVTHVASGAVPRTRIQPHRGWSDREWDDSVARLRSAGWLDDDDHLTASGANLRTRIEDATDRLATLRGLDTGTVERIVELATPIGRDIVDHGLIPVPNPIGVDRP